MFQEIFLRIEKIRIINHTLAVYKKSKSSTIMKNNKLVLFVALSMFSALILSSNRLNAQTNLSTSAEGNKTVQHKGNVFELRSEPADTIYVENIETHELERKVSFADAYPIKMNDIEIVSKPQSPALPNRSLNEYFIDLIFQNKALFDQLPDGQYFINPRHFVVNEEGEILYYKFDGIDFYKKMRNPDMLTKSNVVNEKINNLINDLINSGKIRFEAAQNEGKKVLSVASGAFLSFTVTDHKANIDL